MKKRKEVREDIKREITKVYLCPKCKSKDVGKVYRLKNLFGLFHRWKCRKCGYEDIIFPLLDLKKAMKSKRSRKSKRKIKKRKPK